MNNDYSQHINSVNKPYLAETHDLWRISLLLIFLILYSSTAESRQRTFCGVVKKDCGGHLQPQCSSGSICNSGHNSYTINLKIDCPYPISDQTITEGCYDKRPNCDDCSASQQAPCPEEAAPFCTVGCDAGLVEHETYKVCSTPGASGIPPGELGNTCAPGLPCKNSLSCQPGTQICVAKQKVGQFCQEPLLGCDAGLVCSFSNRCAHSPGREGEACDALFSPCGNGLYCSGVAGFAYCKRERTIGESCSPLDPCRSGLSCEACFVDGCDSALQCFPASNEDGLTENQCRNFFSPALRDSRMKEEFPLTLAPATGGSAAAGIGISTEVGVAYGPEGRVGCFSTICSTAGIDLGIGIYGELAFYDSFDDVAGFSFGIYQEVSFFKLLSYNASQILAGKVISNGLPRVVGPDSPARLIGTAASFGLGAPSPLPGAGGVMSCETRMTELSFDSDDLIIVPEPIPEDKEEQTNQTGAISFDGINDKLALQNTTALSQLEMTNAFTVSGWFKPDNKEQTASLLSKEGEYQIGLQNGTLAYSVANSKPGWLWIETSYVLPTNKWTHVALVFSGHASEPKPIRMYVNGLIAHEISGLGLLGDNHTASDEFHIAGRQLFDNVPYSGLADSIRIWSRDLSSQEVAQSMYENDPSTLTGLVTEWLFNETSGNDISGSSLEFTLDMTALGSEKQATRIASRSKKENAVYFANDGTLVSISDEEVLAEFSFQNAFTFETWIYPLATETPTQQNLINKNGEYSLSLSANDTILFELATIQPGWSEVDTGIVIERNKWSHIAWIYDGLTGETRILINGEQHYSLAASGVISDTNISENAVTLGENFYGLIDEVRIWNVVRSNEQLQTSYDRPLVDGLNGLIAYWPLNDNHLPLALDYSGQHHHGQFGGGSLARAPYLAQVETYAGYPESLFVAPCSELPMPDEDQDGVCDLVDNCPLIENADQTDSNQNGVGDACSAAAVIANVEASSLTLSSQTVQKGALNIPILRFQLDSNYAGNQLDRLNIQASGSGNDGAIVAVRLWHDRNNNGEVDIGDTEIGSGSYNGDNGNVNLTPTSLFLLPAGISDYIVSYDF